MSQQIEVDESAQLLGVESDAITILSPDLAYRRLAMVNVVYVGAAGAKADNWVLVDAGLMGTASAIIHAAEDRFGDHSRPSAIVLTHGHFDHVGALSALAEQWDVPIYAHTLEHPYLDGSRSYPPPDPSVGGGLMSLLSRFYPRGPIDVSRWLMPLPSDGRIPALPGWRWIHTPGHTPGHISLWRESNRTLIAGDAIVTTAQESAYAVLTQHPELHGPPMYFTTDWDKAAASVRRLAELEPEVIITGHGRPMHGPEMRKALYALARDFEWVAIPAHGE